MPLPKVVKFGDFCVDLCARGASSFIKPDTATALRTEQGTLLWDPGIDGVLGGVGFQEADSDHGGERHLDGDELLYLITGRMRLSLLETDGSTNEIQLNSGDAVLVPQGRWHRLIIDEPSHYVTFGGGRTEIRPQSKATITDSK